MKVTGQKEENLTKARAMINEASTQGSKMVILPEMFNCPYQESRFPEFAEQYPAGRTFQMLEEAAREEGIYLVGGSVPERDGPDLYNSSFAFDPRGRLIARHRKTHLFDVDIAGRYLFSGVEDFQPGKRNYRSKDRTLHLRPGHLLRYPFSGARPPDGDRRG